MSDMMMSRDRSLVADIPVIFDSDFMVFVSPSAAEKSKATSPIKPFPQEVTVTLVSTSCLFSYFPDVVCCDCSCAGVCRDPGGHGVHDGTDWLWGRCQVERVQQLSLVQLRNLYWGKCDEVSLITITILPSLYYHHYITITIFPSLYYHHYITITIKKNS